MIKWPEEGQTKEQRYALYPCIEYINPESKKIKCPNSICRVEDCGGEKEINLGLMTRKEAEEEFGKDKIFIAESATLCPDCSKKSI